MNNHKPIPLVRPTLVPWDEVQPLFAKVWESGQLTTGEYTAQLEQAIAKVIGCKHVIAVSSCTSGLMLVLRALNITKEVIIPSFTWTSTGHALIWNNVRPIFADCHKDTFTLDPQDVKKRLTNDTEAIFCANVFGLHPDMDALKEVADQAGIPLLSDSAQAIGATYKGRPAGRTAFAEVFSMSPTKVVTAVEGGLVTTDDDDFALKIRKMRDYGKSENGADVELFGLSARISEFHSIVGLLNLKHRDEFVAARKRIAQKYLDQLSDIKDLAFQAIPDGYESSYNYFVICLKEREELVAHLESKGIASKRYFYPPLHRQATYACIAPANTELPITDEISDTALALPFYSHMTDEDVDNVVLGVRSFFE